MRILVTGGAGFIGAHTVRLLLQRGHEVQVVDDLSHGRREAVPAGVPLHVLDVRAPELAKLMLDGNIEAVLHLAAQMDVRKSVADPVFDASVNVLGTLNTLEAARRAGARRFVFASSGGAIYGEPGVAPSRESDPRRPVSPYGVSKLCGEEYCALYTRALACLSLRYANVYGPDQDPLGEAGVVAIFAGRMIRGEQPVIFGDGLQTRDYVHVEDVARANAIALEGAACGALNIGTGREASVLQITSLLASSLGFAGGVRHGPATAGELRRSVVDPAAARTALGWSAELALEAGLESTARCFRQA